MAITIIKKEKLIVADMRHITAREVRKIEKLKIKGYRLENINDGTSNIQMPPPDLGIHSAGGFRGTGGFGF